MKEFSLETAKMKFLVVVMLFCCGMFMPAITGGNLSAACPTGAANVSHSYWPWNNDTYYTMCSCEIKQGFASTGSCEGATDEQ